MAENLEELEQELWHSLKWNEMRDGTKIILAEYSWFGYLITWLFMIPIMFVLALCFCIVRNTRALLRKR